MKFKFDHVTNSSSVSFVVIGAFIEKDLITEEHLQLVKSKTTYLNDLSLEDLQKDLYEYIDILIQDTDLKYSNGDCWDNGDLMVGHEYTNMKEDETLKQFKDRTKKQIKDSLLVDVVVGHIEQCWEDR
jgi:hypothetical protein